MPFRTLSRIAAVALGAVLACGCSRENRSPAAPTQSPTPTPTVPSSPTALSLSVALDRTPLRVSDTATLRAHVRFSDGTESDVSDATWTVADEAISRVSATGQLTILAAGRTSITAKWKSLSNSLTIDALGKQYQFTARVHEAAPTANVALGGVQVVVERGSLDGMVLSTDATGAVTLPPTDNAGFRVRFKRPGYDDATFDVVAFPRDASADIAMAPAEGIETIHISGPDICAVPTVRAPCPNQPGICDWGSLMVTFPVYHSGIATLIDQSNPWVGGAWEDLAIDDGDGTYSEDRAFTLYTTSLPVRAGHRYAVFFSGSDYVVCNRPYRLTMTHPR